jgi:RNA polymerase sigma-70 factor (ECF subfamily)
MTRFFSEWLGNVLVAGEPVLQTISVGDPTTRHRHSDGSSLFRQCYPIAHAVALRRLGGIAPHQVEDVAQESILDAWKFFGRGEVRDVEALKALVAEITRRRAVDLIRHLEAGRRDINVTKPLGDSEARLPAEEPDGLGELDRREVGGMLVALMQKLSREEERLLRAFYVDGMKQREIAEAFGIPLGTVGVTLDRARRKLREAMRGNSKGFRVYL